MLRAFSTRRSGYDRLVDESSTGLDLVEVKLSRSATLPAKLFGSRRKATPERNLPPIPEQKPSTAKIPENSGEKQVKKASKILPIFSIFEKRRREKATAKPEFARYMEYVKEGGTWDANSNMPVIHYK